MPMVQGGSGSSRSGRARLWRARIALGLLTAGLQGMVFAQAPPGAPGLALGRKLSIDELLARKFDYLSRGRRDPFTFRKYEPPKTQAQEAFEAEIGAETIDFGALEGVEETGMAGEGEKDGGQKALTIETTEGAEETAQQEAIERERRRRLMVERRRKERQRAAIKFYRTARAYLGEMDFAEAVKNCNEALGIIDLERLQVPAMEENVLRVRKAAQRLKARRGAEQEFAQLAIKIQGILWRKIAPSAIINGTVLREGQRVGKAQVHRIEPRHVIFLFDGYKVRLRLRN